MTFDYQAWLNRFPGTNFHELNIDWLVESVKALGAEVENWELVNEISYQGAWDITKQYPAWSIVTVNDTIGYISIKPVPAGVNYTNSDYWVLVADFTTQLAGIGSRVSTLEGEMDIAQADIAILDNKVDSLRTWNGRKILWVGDSYGNGWDGHHSIADPYTIASGYLGATCVNISYGGARFGSSGNPEHHYRYHIENYINNHTAADLASFTDVIIIGGANDINFNPTENLNLPTNMYSIVNTVNLVKTYFPNAQIRIGMVARLIQTGGNANHTYVNFKYVLDQYRNGATSNKVKYIDNAELINHNYTLLATDGIHLQNYNQMGIRLAQVLQNGDFDHYDVEPTNIVAETTTDSSSLAPNELMVNTQPSFHIGHTITLDVARLGFYWPAGQNIQFDHPYKFARISGNTSTRNVFTAIASRNIRINVSIPVSYFDSNNQIQNSTQPFMIFAYNDYLYISWVGLMPDTSTTLNAEGITLREGFQITFDEAFC